MLLGKDLEESDDPIDSSLAQIKSQYKCSKCNRLELEGERIDNEIYNENIPTSTSSAVGVKTKKNGVLIGKLKRSTRELSKLKKLYEQLKYKSQQNEKLIEEYKFRDEEYMKSKDRRLIHQLKQENNKLRTSLKVR